MSSEPPAITARAVRKDFRIFEQGHAPTNLREALVRRVRHPLAASLGAHTFTALDDVSFEVGAGEILGLIGGNGAGKSTLLKVLNRISPIDAGRIEVRGRVGSLLEVGTGFHPELTGRENIYLNGTILGMRRAEIRRRFDEIVEFAEIGEFVETPVKRYSSGMAVRLAFSVAVHFDAEILLVDEVLAVGDAAFQRRCIAKIQEVAQGEGRTVLFVSHNMAPIRSMCHRALVLSAGRVLFHGDPEAAIEAYLGSAAGTEDRPGHWPLGGRSGGGALTDLVVEGPDGRSTSHLQTGAAVRLRVQVAVGAGVRRPVVGVRITGGGDFPLASFVSPSGLVDPERVGPQELSLELPTLPLAPGRYGLDLWVIDVEHWSLVDLAQRAGTFEVESPDASAGAYQALHGDGAVALPGAWAPAGVGAAAWRAGR